GPGEARPECTGQHDVLPSGEVGHRGPGLRPTITRPQRRDNARCGPESSPRPEGNCPRTSPRPQWGLARGHAHGGFAAMPTRRDFLAGTAQIIGSLALAERAGLGAPDGDATMRARRLIEEHEARVRPLEREAALAWWNANVSGKDEDFSAK